MKIQKRKVKGIEVKLATKKVKVEYLVNVWSSERESETKFYNHPACKSHLVPPADKKYFFKSIIQDQNKLASLEATLVETTTHPIAHRGEV